MFVGVGKGLKGGRCLRDGAKRKSVLGRGIAGLGWWRVWGKSAEREEIYGAKGRDFREISGENSP